MKTFRQFLVEVAPPAPPGGLPPSGGGLGMPGTLPGGGGMGPPPAPMGGGGLGPMPMGGGMGPPPAPMGGMGAGAPGQSGSTKLKAYNVWDVLERVLQHAP
jgi:hypothetical protein